VGQQLLGAVDDGVVDGGGGAPDLGDHAEQAGGVVRGLAGLGAQQGEQVTVGHRSWVDVGEGGGQGGAGREFRQGVDRVCHRCCHGSNVHSSTDKSAFSAAARRRARDDSSQRPAERPHTDASRCADRIRAN
jgi:hypothetical protein